MVPGLKEQGGGSRWSAGHCWGSETVLHDSVAVDIGHYTSAQTHRRHHSKSQPRCEPWTVGGDAVSM